MPIDFYFKMLFDKMIDDRCVIGISNTFLFLINLTFVLIYRVIFPSLIYENVLHDKIKVFFFAFDFQ